VSEKPDFLRRLDHTKKVGVIHLAAFLSFLG